ncbi:MAG: UvrD-helicase domain-containing protein [Myxococcales bacterium]|nr:UvrD-helicase domain-containing protein [Myxococcales bacterium]
MTDLSGLNPQQYEAVVTTEGPVLVLAGAGSGKTRVITFRIAHLLDQGVPPERILALSFTNKAAGEMRERLIDMVGKPARKCLLSTFHALGVFFLKQEAANVGLAPGFTIMDEADQRDAVRRALKQLGFDTDRYDPKVVHARISHHKGRMTQPDPRYGRLDGVVRHVLPLYEQRLKAMNAVDFDDLIGIPVRAMERDADIAERWAQRFRFVMVDEYQDTNGAQLRMVKGLVRGYGNVCVVGDDDQSIYAWRGAVAGNILRFDEHFPGSRTIMLTQNYRSTNNVLRAANHVIRNNAERHEKVLWSQNGDGPRLRYHVADTDDAEAHWMATDLLRLKHSYDLHWRDLAVLYRTNSQSRVVEEAIRAAGIPYRVVGGTKFFDRKEVRDVLAYLRVIANPYDEAAWRRIVNYPARGVGDKSVHALGAQALAQDEPFWLYVAEPERVADLPPRAAKGLQHLHGIVEAYRRRFAAGEPLGEVCRDLIRTVGFADELVRTYATDRRQVQKRLENVQEVASALKAFQDREPGGSLEDFLARTSLDTRREEPGSADADEVSLMTLHGSKGLEFLAVWLVGWEEGILPHQRTLDGEGEIAEERRLAYVGITRAKRHLTLSGARKRLKFGRVVGRKPSRFLEEIPDELFEGGRTGTVPGPTPQEREAKAKSAFAAMLGSLGE